ncbi:MAG: phosphoribosylglycinamide formyltransferase [Candidatus Limnocylindria bacterium]
MRLGFLVSGRGSNLEAVLRAVAEGRLPGVDPVLVISNRPDVRALEVAAAHRVPSLVLRRRQFADAAGRDAAIGRALSEAGADLALLAGYDQLLDAAYFDSYAGRTLNIHPSLLPRHGGKGMTGMAVHASVLAAGDPETGVTIHEVTAELDAGPAIARSRVAVRAGEPVEALAERVLAAEHRLIVATIGRLVADQGPREASGSMTAASRAPVGSGAQQQRTHPDA